MKQAVALLEEKFADEIVEIVEKDGCSTLREARPDERFTLRDEGCRDGIERSSEDGHHAVARRLHHLPGASLDGRSEDGVVPPQGVLHRLWIPLPETRAALEVGEQERHRAGRGEVHAAHDASPDRKAWGTRQAAGRRISLPGSARPSAPTSTANGCARTGGAPPHRVRRGASCSDRVPSDTRRAAAVASAAPWRSGGSSRRRPCRPRSRSRRPAPPCGRSPRRRGARMPRRPDRSRPRRRAVAAPDGRAGGAPGPALAGGVPHPPSGDRASPCERFDPRCQDRETVPPRRPRPRPARRPPVAAVCPTHLRPLRVEATGRARASVGGCWPRAAAGPRTPAPRPL